MRNTFFSEDSLYQTQSLKNFILKEKFISHPKRREHNGVTLSYFISPIPKKLFF